MYVISTIDSFLKITPSFDSGADKHQGNINQRFAEGGHFYHAAFSLLLCFEN